MTSRHFGISSRTTFGGDKPSGSLHGANSTRTDLYSTDLEIGARWFVAICALSPFILFGISFLVIRWFE